MELRMVDPKKLLPNPENPRRTKASPEADTALAASIATIGLNSPPLARVTATHEDGSEELTIIAGNRRRKAAIAAGLKRIPVLVRTDEDRLPSTPGAAATDDAGGNGETEATRDATRMIAVSENVVRAEMGPVDRWRAMRALGEAGWTDPAICAALSLTPRALAQLRMFATIYPGMLDRMAKGDMPAGAQLAVIASASAEDQATAWKQNKPKKDEATDWQTIARALTKERWYARDARFGTLEAEAFGIVWEEDLFAPAGQDSRSTTQFEAFLRAQTAWLDANAPENATVAEADPYGRPILPAGAIRCWGEPREGDLVAHAVDPRTGKIEVVGYTLPPAKAAGTNEEIAQPARAPRPDITAKGVAMVGDLRTGALHAALRDAPIDDLGLVSLLILALGSRNVEISSAVAGSHGSMEVRRLAKELAAGGVITQDTAMIRQSARRMLEEVLSCRMDQSNSGATATAAALAVSAEDRMPGMAHENFLSCLSKAGLARVAAAHGIAACTTGKETRAAIIQQLGGTRWVHPAARFEPVVAELMEDAPPDQGVADDDPKDPEFGRYSEAAANADAGLGGGMTSRPDDIADAPAVPLGQEPANDDTAPTDPGPVHIARSEIPAVCETAGEGFDEADRLAA